MLPEKMLPFPRTVNDLRLQAEQLKCLPDSQEKLAAIHALAVFCNCNSDCFKQVFQDSLAVELERLKVLYWPAPAGMKLLAGKVERNGGKV